MRAGGACSRGRAGSLSRLSIICSTFQTDHSKMVQPPAKKRRTRSSRPDLSTELIGRVATYSGLCGGELMKICAAVGPAGAAVIKRSYLLNNDDYLRNTIQAFRADLDGTMNITEKVWWKTLSKYQLNARAWVEVNTRWKDRCTEEKMVEQREVHGVVVNNPDALFNNPVVAVSFGLTEVLKYLVEEKRIDVNGYLWNDYLTSSKNHLFAFAIDYHEPSLRYLVSVEGIDLGAQLDEDTRVARLIHHFITQATFGPELTLNFVRHPSIDLNEGPTVGYATPLLSLLWYVEDIIKDYSASTLDHTLWMTKLKILLDEGADPTLREYNNGVPSAIDFARNEAGGHPHCSFWKEAVELMENAANNRAEES